MPRLAKEFLRLRGEFASGLAAFDIADAQVEIRRPAERRQDIDVAGLRRELREEIHLAALHSIESSSTRAAALERQVARVSELEAQLSRRKTEEEDHTRVAEEIRAQLPHVRRATVAPAPSDADARATPRLVIVLETSAALPASELQRLRRWLGVRVPKTDIELVVGRRAA